MSARHSEHWPPIVSWYTCWRASREVDWTLTCESCGVHPAVGVASSSLAPMSVAWCLCCLRAGYEPPHILEATVEIVGWENLHPAVQSMVEELRRA